MSPKPYTIAFLGRPNVGKSSLFNALLGFRRAIVLDLPGTTRDEVVEKARWLPAGAVLCDSQGMFGEEDGAALDSVIARGDAFLFVVDYKTGVTPFDRWLAGHVKRSGKPVCLLVNKAENRGEVALADFAELAIDEAIPVSAAHRMNLSDVREWCLAQAPGGALPSPDAAEPLTIALIGRPNTGKSTLMNRLAGDRVSRVSPEPLTTRDPVAYDIPGKRGLIKLVDTAGMRRPRSTKDQLEVYSVQATTRSIRAADVVFLCVACHEPVSDQDIRLINLVEREGKPMVVLLNFWDRLTAEQRQRFLADSDFGGLLRKYERLAVSGLTGWQCDRILAMAWRLAATAKKRIRTSRLNRFVEVLVQRNPPPARGKQNFNILYASQVRVEPPTFVFFMNRKANLPVSYQKYVENAVRDNLGFRGQTIRVFFRGND